MAMPDAAGGTLWHPPSLDAIYDLPERVFRLYLAYRAGQAYASNKAAGGGKQGMIGGKKVG